jgi:hypothetical protein
MLDGLHPRADDVDVNDAADGGRAPRRRHRPHIAVPVNQDVETSDRVEERHGERAAREAPPELGCVPVGRGRGRRGEHVHAGSSACQ